jgi:predicted Zn-dependent peptidase
MSSGPNEIHVDHVDGVPLLWMEGPPPFTMFLIFRVGQADERLQIAGITHLVEHLAFPHDHGDAVGNNGTTDLTSTRFFAWGEPDEAAQFMRRVSQTLSRLPIDRLDQQRDIIATEEQRWAVTPGGELLIARYGARAHGLAGFRQLGLRAITPSEVTDWAARYFTAGNAIVCMTGPPPGRLSLELPDGPNRPAPLADPEPAPFPRWTPKPQAFVAISVTGGHDSAMGAAARMVERRLFDRLRTRKALSYAVHADTKLIDANTLHRMFAADCLEDAAPQVTDEVIATAYEFAESGPTKAEMDDDIDRLERQLRMDERAGIGWMLYAAECYLSGIEVEEFDEYIERRLSLERNEIRDAWRAACEGLLLCVPPWVTVNDGRFAIVDWPPVVSGRTFHPPGFGRFRGGTRAVLSDAGFSLVGDRGDHATITFDRVAALLRGRAGFRTVIAMDGSEVSVDPAAFASGEDLVAGLDRAVPRERWITFA